MFGTLVVIKKNGEEGSKYSIIENQVYKFGPSFDCQLRFYIKDIKQCNKYCTLSTIHGKVLFRKTSSCPIFINNEAVVYTKLVKSGDVLKVGSKTFKWITNSETPSSIRPKSSNVEKFLRTLKEQRRGSTENVQKNCRRSSRNSTIGCVRTWEETNEGMLVSSKEDLKMKQFPTLKNAKKVSRTLRNSTAGCFSAWEETNSSVSSSKNDLNMKQFIILESLSKPSNPVVNEECSKPLKSTKKTPQMKSKSSNKIFNSMKKLPSKIPKVFLGTLSKSTAEKTAPAKASKSCMLAEDKSPLGVGKVKRFFRNVDSPAKFSTSTFAVQAHSSSVSTTEMSPDKLKSTSLTPFKGNWSQVELEPRISLVKLSTDPSLDNFVIHTETNCLEKPNLRLSPRKTSKKMTEAVTPLSSKKSLTPTLNKTVSLPIITTVKTPDTSMNKPLLTPNIKAIKSTNKRNASLEKSLDNKMLAKKRKISNVMGSDASNTNLHDISNAKESTVILSPKAKLHSSSYSISKPDLASDITQKNASFCMNVSGIDKLVHSPRDLRNSSITSEEHVVLFDSPGKVVKNRKMLYSTPKSKSVSDWSVADFTVETPKNITSNAKDRSLKFVSETPEYNLSRDQTNAFINQTFDKTGRRSKTPKQNKVVENSFNETFDVSSGRKSKTFKQDFIVSNIFNESLINTTNTINRSLRSESKEISVNDRSVNMSRKRRSETPQKILTVSLGTPIKITENDSMTRFSARQTHKDNLTNLKGIKRLPKSPINDLTHVAGVKQLLRTPGPQPKSPKNDLSDLRGVKQLLEPLQTCKPPRNDLTNIAGIRELFKTPGRRQKEKEPKNDLTNVAGVKHLLKTPGRKLKEMEPENDLSNVAGVKHLLKTPGRKLKEMEPENDLTNVAGVKHLMKSPERKRKETEPKNDLRNVFGVKTLLRSPRRKQKEPENDLTNVAGVKYLLRSPLKKKKESEPENDLTNVFGVKKLLRSPRRKQNEPKNDLSDLRGVKRLMEPTKEPRNDLSDVDGVAEIMKSPELRSRTPTRSQTTNLTNTDINEQNTGLIFPQVNRNISFRNNGSMDDMFDKLICTNDSLCELDLSPHRHALKTYERKVKSISPVKSSYIDNEIKSRNSLRFIDKDTKVVDKWLEEHKKYQDTLMACVVNIETGCIEQTPVEEDTKPVTHKKNRRVKSEEIERESIGQAPLQDEPIPVTRKRNLRGKKEVKYTKASPQDKPIAITRKRNLRSKQSEDIDPESIAQEPLEDEPKSITRKRNIRVKKIETEETVDELPTEVKPKRGRPKTVDTKITRTKRNQKITEETDVPAVKKRRTSKNDDTPVKIESPDVKEVVVIKKITRTTRNTAKPVLLSDTVVILEHNNLPQLDFEALGVKPKAVRKRKVKDKDTLNVQFNVPEELPVKEVKRNTRKTKKESPTPVRRSGRNKK